MNVLIVGSGGGSMLWDGRSVRVVPWDVCSLPLEIRALPCWEPIFPSLPMILKPSGGSVLFHDVGMVVVGPEVPLVGGIHDFSLRMTVCGMSG